MTKTMMTAVAIAGLTMCAGAHAQNEGMVPTQALVTVEAKSQPPASAANLTIQLDGKKMPLSSWTPVAPGQVQVALLIDDGLRESVGRNLSTLKEFVNAMPAGVEVLVGYMENGRVLASQGFTTNHAAAAAALRLPEGMPGQSASPYFCLSDFVKHWPGAGGGTSTSDPAGGTIMRGDANGSAKARFVLMITNGVDPYNGSTSLANQDSPYVKTAITDAQRAGVPVYSIYFTDAGIRGQSAAFSGQSYLQQVADATGGRNYYEGMGNPVDMTPFLKEFTASIGRTFIAGFEAPAKGRDLVRLKVTSAPKAKLRSPEAVQPGNME
jgi:hypothetical protein